MKNLLLKLLLRYYSKRNKEINKLSNAKEVSYYRFNKPEHTEEILKAEMTADILKYWAMEGKDLQILTKGGTAKVDNIIRKHQLALKLWDKYPTQSKDDSAKREKAWVKLKLELIK